ncbi:PQQ-dependent sugar dehydrogenase [Halomicrobium salinisoli]|uniref:PQQ-dependent sugar dehydrogenase n=1 Tax=Halomicrobium salinisoli TaxID=2878391 RepID=UPI001CF01E07|nr:PQQ-dependent sugar dehydrogenase [Halomicrobium salinisoli]
MTEDDNSTGSEPYPASVRRRSVLKGVAAASGVGLAGVGLAQQDGPVAIRLDGDTAGWMVPDDAGDPVGEGPNPTLTLQPGQDYEVTWENVDGQPHNFAVVDGDDETLLSSEIIEEQGATQTVEFTASEEMAEYLCDVHPVSMRGDVEIGGGAGTATPAGGGQAARFFQRGTEVGVQVVAEGMTAPTDFEDHPELDFYYVTDQTGELWTVDPDEGLSEEPVLNVSDRMVELGTYNGQYGDPESEYDERGLLGVELHPEFPDDQRLFLHYSRPPNEETPEDWSHVEVVSSFEVSEDGTTVDGDSEQVLLSFQKPQYNHDSGPMAFGPDGYLYVPMGDGGGANDDMYGHVDDWYDQNAGGNGQDVTENLLGDVHRIDVDGGDGDRPYGIPEDNPFAGDSEGLDEIYAYGFRNPYGISFDSQGNCFVADAGQNLFEEADVVERGGNYGWNVKEGTHCFSTENAADPEAITDCPDTEPDEAPYDGSELIDPIVEYPHTYQGQNVGIVIIGGHRYENDVIGGLQGKYVFGEWTKDPSRNEPMGRILAATPPEGFDGEGGGTPAADDGDATAGNASAGNATGGDAATVADGVADDNATDGNVTGGKTAPQEPEIEGEEVVPRDELWEMEELVVQGGEDGTLSQFVRMFGRNEEGEIFVLANQLGRLLRAPDSETGYLFKLVPPEEGEELPAIPDPLPGEEPEETAAGDDAAGNETAGNMTAGNETDDAAGN